MHKMPSWATTSDFRLQTHYRLMKLKMQSALEAADRYRALRIAVRLFAEGRLATRRAEFEEQLI